MSVQPKALNQMTQDAIAILMKIGIANTLRFLNQFSTGYGNDTEEPEARFKDLTLAELLQQMAEQQSAIVSRQRSLDRFEPLLAIGFWR